MTEETASGKTELRGGEQLGQMEQQRQKLIQMEAEAKTTLIYLKQNVHRYEPPNGDLSREDFIERYQEAYNDFRKVYLNSNVQADINTVKTPLNNFMQFKTLLDQNLGEEVPSPSYGGNQGESSNTTQQS